MERKYASENMLEVSKLLRDGINNYSDIKDLFKEEVLENDVVELFGDCSKVVKFLSKTKKIVEMGMFTTFLKGFSIGDETEEEKLKKLKEYIDDEDKAMFISKTLNKILDAKSKHAVFILGYMINTLIENERRLNPKYVILADALTHMFDHDIENIRFFGDYYNYKVYDNRKKKSKSNKSQKRYIYINKKFKDILKENDLDDKIVYLTLEKCCSYQLMVKYVESNTDLDLDGIDVSYDKENDNVPEISTGTALANTEVEESYGMTIVGELLYDLIIELDIKKRVN